MRMRAALLAVVAATSCAVVACSSLNGKWKPSTELTPDVLLVEPRQEWMDTGMDVTAGQLLFFTATGEVRWASSAGLGVGLGPDGLDGSPGWRVGRGGLIGRVGDRGKPFDIGARTRPFPAKNERGLRRRYPPPPIKMPASGRLFLGFKGYRPGANHGAFEVTIKAAAPVVRRPPGRRRSTRGVEHSDLAADRSAQLTRREPRVRLVRTTQRRRAPLVTTSGPAEEAGAGKSRWGRNRDIPILR